MNFSTIAAISTPLGKGGVAVIRISGSSAFEIADLIFEPKNKKKPSECPLRYAIYGSILSSDRKRTIDDGLITLFRGPNSFTGEDVCEIACHGGEVITSMVLSSALENGAVMAHRGEFSERAFMNGKMSLTSAEGVADLLDAKTEEGAILSSGSARGKLSKKIEDLTEKVIKISAPLWAYIDYPEEDLQTLTDQEIISVLDEIIGETEKFVDSYKTGRAINSGINTLIVGKPNVGKSTFFNKLLGENRAIVTNVAGTTRDMIEYPVKFGRMLLNLTDTAGLREKTNDIIEEMGIKKVKEAIGETELVFALFDSSEKFDENDQMVLDSLLLHKGEFAVVPIVTKCDKKKELDFELIKSLGEPVFISAETSDFDELIRKCESIFITDEKMLREGGIIMNARQKSLAVKTLGILRETKQNVITNNKDIASLNLENAVSLLKEIDGEAASEVILNEVFSRFCIGK